MSPSSSCRASASHQHHDGQTSSRPNGALLESTTQHQKQPAWRNALENFSPIWFTVAMNTGILGILMHTLPYQFNCLGVLSTIMYSFTLVLFVLFMAIFLLRLVLFPRMVQKQTAGDVVEASMLSAAPIAFFMVTALTALIASSANWGGHSFSMVAYVMWWIGTVWMLVACISILLLMTRKPLTDGSTMPTALILPVVGIATNATAGGIISTYGIDVSARLAVPIIITSYLLTGLAIFFAQLLYTIFFHRLFASGWPPAPQRPTLFILIGPYGQTAGALLNLSTAAANRGDFAGYSEGTFLTAQAAQSISATSTLLALLLLGFDVLMIAVAVAGVVETLIKRQATYSMSWWSTIYPLGTFTLAFAGLGVALDSPAFRTVSTGLVVILLMMYFVNWGFTIYFGILGELLVKKDRRKGAGDGDDDDEGADAEKRD